MPLDQMCNLFGAAGANFEVIEVASNQPVLVELSSTINVDASLDYLQHYGGISPRVKHAKLMPTGSISYDHMILTEAEMNRDAFYADFLSPIGLRYFLAAQLSCSASHQAVFAVQRSPTQGHVDRDEIALLEQLLPHLQQAIDLKLRMTAARGKARVDLEGLERLGEGCLILDPLGEVLHMNAAAGEIIAGNDGMRIRNGHLRFSQSAASHSFDRALAEQRLEAGQYTPTSDFPAARPSGRRPYLISVRPLSDPDVFAQIAWPTATIVFIRDPDRFSRLNVPLLRQSFQLTQAEADVADALDRGLTPQEMAENQEVSITTIRTHLYSLMAKLNVRRQSDISRLLAQYRQPFT
ncbi:MAG: LuxR C-terminal-related transcriptional regulator [Proteobacteria bacterium]|nr:LuxR C-terminal-related transcriptional regulator [Pseudomonadota bacterium]